MASLKKRGKVYYAQYYIGTKQKRVSLNTDSLQVAKEKIRQIESALVRGTDIPLPTKTPIPKVVSAYCDHLLTVRAARNAQRDFYYLRETFGPICPSLVLKNERISAKCKKRRAKEKVPPSKPTILSRSPQPISPHLSPPRCAARPWLPKLPTVFGKC